MKAETRERFQKIAAEMGYMPNFVGKALVDGRTYTVGLLQPAYEAISYSFYHSIVRGMAMEMEADDYNLLIMFRSPDDKYLRIIERGRVDGLFILQSDQQASEIEKVEATGIPAVVVNKNYFTDSPNMGCVQSANAELAATLVREFVSSGCRRVLEINHHEGSDSNGQIHKALLRELKKAGSGGFSLTTLVPDLKDFRSQARRALAEGGRWDGVYVDGPDIGEVFAGEAEKAGLVAGRDFRMIATHVFPSMCKPPSFAVDVLGQQPELMGREAWRVLSDRMGGRNLEKNVFVPYTRIKIEGER